MSEARDLEEFSRQLKAEVIEDSQLTEDGESDRPTGFKENSFTKIFSGYLADFGVIEDAEVCYFSFQGPAGSMKANGYRVDPETNTALILVSLYHHGESPAHVPKVESRKAIDQALRFFEKAAGGHHMSMEKASDQYAMMQDLHSNADVINRVRLIFLTDGLCAEENIAPSESKGRAVIPEIWDIRRLYRLRMGGLPYEAIEIDFLQRFGKPLACLPLEAATPEYSAYLAIVPGSVLMNLYEEFGPRLLELNVRSFLQALGKVNRSIRDTIRSTPDRFFAYNNGISATAESIDVVLDEVGVPSIVKIRGLQIVNGGQTLASIHRAGKTDKADLSSIFVQAKFTIVRPEKLNEIVPMISRYANSQNKVNEADFSSNDPYHTEMQRLSETTWLPGEQSRWFYERARGQYQVAKSPDTASRAERTRFETSVPVSQKLTKTDLARYIASWEQLPHIVSKGAQANFVDFMLRLRKAKGNDWKPSKEDYQEVIAKAILFRQVQKIVREFEFPAYQANIVTYTVAYLSHRTLGQIEFQKVWQAQALSDPLQITIRSWCKEVSDEILRSAAGRNVTQWCKQEACWHAIRSLNLEIGSAMQEEWKAAIPMPTVGNQAGDVSVALSLQDKQDIAKTMKVSAADWLKIHGWAITSNKLMYIDGQIALTLSGYAASGWKKIPSVKQARRGVVIIEIAKENGQLDGEIEIDPA